MQPQRQGGIFECFSTLQGRKALLAGWQEDTPKLCQAFDKACEGSNQDEGDREHCRGEPPEELTDGELTAQQD
uniref:Uncharacterized protein n=1 Tax=Nothobranchius furzeri TaxID=105023 RepID=A0A1A7ZSW1_NOTFU